MAYYDEEVLFTLAHAIREPVKIDLITLKVSRGKFARVCVKIDLSKPMVGRVCVEGKWYQIKYEGLHIICAQCGCYGHHSRDCLHPRNEKGASSEHNQPVLMVHETPNVVEMVEGSNHSHQIGKDLEIPSNLHGEWLVVTRKSHIQNRVDSKGKGKAINMELNANKSGNRFEKLLIEESKEDNELDRAKIMHEKSDQFLHASNVKSREVTKGPMWKPISVKKKIVSPIQVKLAKMSHQLDHGPTTSAENETTPSCKYLQENQPASIFGGRFEKGSSSGSKNKQMTLIKQRTLRKWEMLKTLAKKSEINGGIRKPVNNFQRKLIMNAKTRQAISKEVVKSNRNGVNVELQSLAGEDDVLLEIKAHPPDPSSSNGISIGREDVERENEAGNMESEEGFEGLAGDRPRV